MWINTIFTYYTFDGLYIRKERTSQINNLSCPLRNLKKEKQIKTKARRGKNSKDRTEIIVNENRKRI